MRVECYNSRYAYDTALPVSRLVSMVGNSILCIVIPAGVLNCDSSVAHASMCCDSKSRRLAYMLCSAIHGASVVITEQEQCMASL